MVDCSTSLRRAAEELVAVVVANVDVEDTDGVLAAGVETVGVRPLHGGVVVRVELQRLRGGAARAVL